MERRPLSEFLNFAALPASFLFLSPVSTPAYQWTRGLQLAEFRPIMLHDKRPISDAVVVNEAINGMFVVAGSCHAASMEAALNCACKSTADLNKLKTAYARSAAAHPDWIQTNTIVTYQDPANGHFVSLNFSAARQMLARCAR